MRLLLLLLVGAVSITSCYTPRYMYSPSEQNVPVLVKQGDSKLSAAYSSNLSRQTQDINGNHESRNRGYDLQGAVAVTNNLAVQASYFNRRESNNGTGRDGSVENAYINYKRAISEIGVGYFTSLHQRNLVFFQVFAGAGKGRFSFTDDGFDNSGAAYTQTHRADITKFYIQPAMIFRTRGSFAGSVSTRLSVIKYHHIQTSYSHDELVIYSLDSLGKGARCFWEPAITNSFGFKKLPGLRIEYQFGLAMLLSRRLVDYRSFNCSFGLVFDIPKLFRTPDGKN